MPCKFCMAEMLRIILREQDEMQKKIEHRLDVVLMELVRYLTYLKEKS